MVLIGETRQPDGLQERGNLIPDAIQVDPLTPGLHG